MLAIETGQRTAFFTLCLTLDPLLLALDALWAINSLRALEPLNLAIITLRAFHALSLALFELRAFHALSLALGALWTFDALHLLALDSLGLGLAFLPLLRLRLPFSPLRLLLWLSLLLLRLFRTTTAATFAALVGECRGGQCEAGDTGDQDQLAGHQ